MNWSQQGKTNEEQPRPFKSKTIVILTASSGGGHNAAAEAIVERIRDEYGNEFQFKLIDIYQKNIVARLPWLAKIRYQSDLLWRIFLLITNNRWAVKTIALIMRPYMLRQINRQLPDNTSHLIAVHFNPAQVITSLAKQFKERPKTSIVATDFDPHWAWLGRGSDQLFVVSDSGVRRAESIDYQAESLIQLPIVPVPEIRCRITRRRPQTRLKFMLVCGQDGSNRKQIFQIIGLINELAGQSNIELTVVCGKNEKLRNELEKKVVQFQSCRLIVRGYVENIARTFHRFDLMLVRTSPGVLSECVSAGVPVLGFDWTAHESFQATYINQNQLGLASRKSAMQAEFLARAVGDSDYLKSLQENVNTLRRRFDYSIFAQRLVQGVG